MIGQMPGKYVIFLDIDGVFTSNRVHMAHNGNEDFPLWIKFDPVAVDFMNKFHDEYYVDFVLMSTWKDYIEGNHTTQIWIWSAFANSGFRGNFHNEFRTNNEMNPELHRKDRAHQVKEWLENNKGYDDFLLFDDSKYAFNQVLGRKRHVHTDCDNGLLFKHMKAAQSMTSEWVKKNG